ncbi:MAG TPA: TaqI-like C-terminal specificity domain-containing protein [Ktedonobacteraceae bacterium]
MHGILEKQITWYEASLSLQERRGRGHFSTPPRLVEHILDACGYTPDSDLHATRVLDPACGSGNFLAAAAHRLVSFVTRTGLPQEERAALVQRNLWGFDPDPVSCFLSEMQLSAAVTPCVGSVDAPMSITVAATRWHIHQADGLALPWPEPCVDLFLANPPYLAAKNTDLSAYPTAHRRGQADSYLLFLNLGLQIVRPGGWLGLVLPDPLLARTNAVSERTRLLKEFTIHHLWHLSDVFTAQVGAVVIVAQKSPPKSQHQVAWKREKWKHITTATSNALSMPLTSPASTISQSLLLHQPCAELRYLLSNEQGSILERLQSYLASTPSSSSALAPLKEFVSISRGEELGRKSSYLIQQETSHSPNVEPSWSPLDTALLPYFPLLRGGKDIQPFWPPHSRWWIAREAIAKPLERYLSPKLLVVKSTDRLQAVLDLQGHVALQTLYLLHLRKQDAPVDDFYFFLALLNSRLLQRYVYVLYTAYKWVQPQIEQHVLAQLPVPIVTASEKEAVIARSKLLVHACSPSGSVVEWRKNTRDVYEEQERVLSAFYNALMC